MRPQHGYFEDPLLLEFNAQVTKVVPLTDGRTGVILERTWFYPTGGGQAHDVGTLNDVPVVDVYRQEETGEVVHVLEGALPAGPVHGKIDGERRLRHMQHHTAQHLLSACFYRLFGLETLSSHISGYSPSTTDFSDRALGENELRQVERLAHEVIFQNRLVKTYFVPAEEVQRVPLRRPPKVAGEIRVVEIEDFDYSACGGTHCLSTGMIGVVKILKTERQNQKTRLHFVAGWQALEYFKELHAIVGVLGATLSVGKRDLLATVQRQTEALRAAQKELKALRLERIQAEAQVLLSNADSVGNARLVTALFAEHPAGELQALAKALVETEGVVAVLASVSGEGKLSVVLARHEEVELHAGECLRHWLAPLGARGGGDASFAQGGGTARMEQVGTWLNDIPAKLKEVFDGVRND